LSVHCPQVLAKRRNACPDLEAFACSISSLLGAWSHMGAAFMASSSAAHVVVASIPCTDAPPSGRGASSSASPPPNLGPRRRKAASCEPSQLKLCDLPADLLVRIVEHLPTVECIARLECVSTAWHGVPRGRSVVEEGLRARAAFHVGAVVPAGLSLGELYSLERCRRGVRLTPLSIDGRADGRRPILLVRGRGIQSPQSPQSPQSVLVGRTTRVVDNGQRITDPRVSRRHAEVALLRVPTLGDDEPFSLQLGRLNALGHNPSRHLGVPHGGAKAAVERKVRRGETIVLRPGDEVHLVCEDVSRAHGRSAAFEGNTCAYRIDLVSEADLQQLALAQHKADGQARHLFSFWEAPLPDWDGAFESAESDWADETGGSRDGLDSPISPTEVMTVPMETKDAMTDTQMTGTQMTDTQWMASNE